MLDYLNSSYRFACVDTAYALLISHMHSKPRHSSLGGPGLWLMRLAIKTALFNDAFLQLCFFSKLLYFGLQRLILPSNDPLGLAYYSSYLFLLSKRESGRQKCIRNKTWTRMDDVHIIHEI